VGQTKRYFYVREQLPKYGRQLDEYAMFEMDFPIIMAKKTRTLLRKKILGPELAAQAAVAAGRGAGNDSGGSGTETTHRDGEDVSMGGLGAIAEDPSANGGAASGQAASGQAAASLNPYFAMRDTHTVVNRLHGIHQLSTPSYKLLGCDMRRSDEFTGQLREAGFQENASIFLDFWMRAARESAIRFCLEFGGAQVSAGLFCGKPQRVNYCWLADNARTRD